MLKRLALGPLKGGVLGLAVGFALVHGLGVEGLAGARSHAAAALVGFASGLFTGKPIWTRGAWLEGLLKAVAGGGLAAAVLFILRRFVRVNVDAGPLGAGDLLGLPLVVLPALGAILGLLFEIDDAVGRSQHSSSRPS
jgi:hypothetical protein